MDLTKLIDVEVASKICVVDAESLLHWCQSGHAPHYMIDDKGPFFRRSEIVEWVKENLLTTKGGFPVPRTIDVLRVASIATDYVVPFSISQIHNLCRLAISAACSGVYFLCHRGAVVYVGQSVQVFGRVATHVAERVKEFDHEHVYFLPCPKDALDRVESDYIRILKPKYNYRNTSVMSRGQDPILVSPNIFDSPTDLKT